MFRRSLLALILFSRFAAALDLTHSSVVSPQGFSAQEQQAVRVLVEEVAKRTQVTLPVVHTAPQSPTISIANAHAGAAEGFRLTVNNTGVSVTGNDARGVLFGIGRLLREMHLTRQSITIADSLTIETAPKYKLRGHQLGYRPKTNSYDAWSVPMWDQYIRDLTVFGTNAIELIPPRSDDDADSPHFPLPPMQMMVEMSKIIDSYGLDVWIWYPAMDKDYSDPKTVEFAMHEWAEVYKRLPRIDAIFVPGGDPGHTPPKHLMALLEKQTALLHRYHPKAQMWVSPQSFDQQWLDEFIAILRDGKPAWLTGVVFGPQVRVSAQRLRQMVPANYPIRHYPDITHSRQAEYPVPDWDLAYAMTEARETINPRPLGEAQIFRVIQPLMAQGFLTYSEGCNDDVNKFVWSALGWNPDADVTGVLRDYSRYFIGESYADTFAQGLLALERNWVGPLIANAAVYTTLQQFQALERSAAPHDLQNWRFQQALYRAYYDGYTRSRLIHETEQEARALEHLRAGSIPDAEASLDQSSRVSEDWRARIFELAEALFQSVRMQLSVTRYKAISVGRGANLDTLDFPLNNRLWLKQRFEEIRKLPEERQRAEAISSIVNWTNPGPGGFYDDLGNSAAQPHLLKGPGFAKDPAFLESALSGFQQRPEWRTSWGDYAEALGETPLQMHYTALDPTARYKIRVMYTGDSQNRKIKLDANRTPVHPLIAKPSPPVPLEFDLPTNLTDLTLTWSGEPGLGGNGRGTQVAEVWILRTSP
ncbi:MAG: glycoside hydrolase family 20 zincin-like fold domain-containing protein [Bryobacteraceae bacterium]